MINESTTISLYYTVNISKMHFTWYSKLVGDLENEPVGKSGGGKGE